MPFEINPDSLLIKGRRGDSGSFTFDFDQDLSEYCVDFYVKRNLNDPDDKTIIKKSYKNIEGTVVTIDLLPSETEKLLTRSDSYVQYYWGLKIHIGDSFAQTIIPMEFKNAPIMCVYPQLGGCK